MQTRMMMNKKMWWIQVWLLLMLFAPMVQAGTCSTYDGSFYINEANTKENWVEIYAKIPSTISGWTLKACTIDNKAKTICDSPPFSYDQATDGSFKLIYPNLDFKEKIADFLLMDQNGKPVDYFRLGSKLTDTDLQSADAKQCGLLIDCNMLNRDNAGQRNFYRINDGQCGWAENNWNDNTKGTSNNAGLQVVSITRKDPDPTTAGSTVSWTVTFNSPVTGVDINDFQLVSTGTLSGYSIGSVTGSGAIWTVTANTGSDSGTLGLNLVDNDTIKYGDRPLGGAGMRNGNFTGQIYTINKPPIITTLAATGLTNTGAVLNGSVNPNGRATTVNFSYGTSSGSYTHTCTPGTATYTGSTTQNFSCNLSNLICGTTYYYRANGTYGAGTTKHGSEMSFKPLCLTPTAAKSFNPATIQVGNTSRLTITLSNPNNTAITGTALTDNYPAGMLNAATPGVSNTCGGTVTASAGASSLVLNGGNIPANGSCSISVTVTANVTGTLTNSTGNVTSTNAATAPPATATLTVSAANLLAYYRFEDLQWSSSQTQLEDFSGNNRHATAVGDSGNYPEALLSTPARGGNPGTCGYAGFNDGTNQRGYFSVPNIGLSENTGATTSVSFWVYFTGNYNSEEVVLGWPGYNLYFNDNYFGLNTNNGGDVLGVKLGEPSGANAWANQWKHVVVVLKNGYPNDTVMYVNGALQSLSRVWGTASSTDAAKIRVSSTALNIGKQAGWNGYRFTGKVDEVKLYNGTLTAAQALALYTETHPCDSKIDHFRIEHDGSASACGSENMVVKACANTDCSELFQAGGITAKLQPGDKDFSIGTSGSATVAASFTSLVGTQTLSINGSNIAPTNGVKCAKNGTIDADSCKIAVSACPTGSNFNCLETGLPVSNARLYTKLVGTPFSFDVVALNKDNGQETNYVVSGGSDKSVTVELGTYDPADCASGFCPLSPPQTQTLTFSATDPTPPGLGRKKTADFTVQQAYKKLKCRVTETGQPTNQVGYSTDGFSVRPKQFSISSPLNNATLTDTPKAIAGTAFEMTADTGLAPTAGYNGKPELVFSKIVDHADAFIATDSLKGEFATGDGVKAVGNNFQYFDVGNIKLLKDAVVDSGFTGIDKAKGDCIAGSTDNTPSADPLTKGQYGCNVGSAESAKFGRWHPSHFSLSATFTPACALGGFTYMGDDHLGIKLDLKAHAKGSGVASALDPVASRYVFRDADGNGVQDDTMPLAQVTITAESQGLAVPVSKLKTPDFPAMPNKSHWGANGTGVAGSGLGGVFTIDDTYSFERGTAPVTGSDYYGDFKFKAALTDPDGATLISPDTTSATKILYGRLRLSNAFGTVAMPPKMNARTQYWSGNSWINFKNATSDPIKDSCTTLTTALFSIKNPNPSPNSAVPKLIPNDTTGPWQIEFTTPSKGSADVCADLTAMPWLGTACGKVTFGIYPAETKKTVHTRELY